MYSCLLLACCILSLSLNVNLRRNYKGIVLSNTEYPRYWPERSLSNHAHQSVDLGFSDRRNTSSISLSSISSSPLTSPKRCSLTLFDIEHNLSIVNFLQTQCHHHHRSCMSILTYLPTLTRLQTMSPSSNGSVRQKLFAPTSFFLNMLH